MLLLDELHQPALGGHGVSEVQARELDLPGERRREEAGFRDALVEPVVERPMVLEFQRAERMRHALDAIGQAVRPVVRRVDAPLVARAVVVRMPDAVHHRVAQVHVGRAHVDLRAQYVRAVRMFAVAHLGEQAPAFGRSAVAVGRIAAGLGERAAIRAQLVGRLRVDIGMAALDQRLRELIQPVEIVGRVVLVRPPLEAEPAHRLLDRVDILLLFLRRVGVVEAQVAAPAVLGGEAEVEADRLRMPEMKIAVRLGRKARHHRLVLAGGEIRLDDLTDEVARGGQTRFVHRRILLAAGKPPESNRLSRGCAENHGARRAQQRRLPRTYLREEDV